jgi:ribonuclease P protein component
MTSQKLTRRERLSHRRDFEAVFQHRRAATGDWVIVFGRPNNRSWNRLGLSVGKRLGSAVVRNRFKRLCREAFRLTKNQQPVGWDWVIAPRVASAEAAGEIQRPRWKSAEIQRDVLRQMQRLGRRRGPQATDAEVADSAAEQSETGNAADTGST